MFSNISSLNQNYLNKLEESESNGNEIIEYKPETVDFPDSPKFFSPLGIMHKEKEDYFDEISKESIRKPRNDVLTSTPDCSVIIQTDKSFSGFENDNVIDSMPLDDTRRKISFNPTILEDDQRSLSSLSSRSNIDVFPSDDVVFDEDDRETLDEMDEFSDTSFGRDQIPEVTAAEELEEERSWKSCVVNGENRKIDMKVIEPYRKVLSHGGYEETTCNAIIVFSACHLPDRSRKDYNYVMDNLFLYVVVTLDELITEDYVLIYLHGATESSSMPSFGWLKRCYQMIDRRLRKNLKKLYLVHPTFWLKTIVIMTRPFISAKFSRKLKFVYTLRELATFVTLQHANIPEKVKNFDKELYPVESLIQQ